MRAPEFWAHDGLAARALAPLGLLWRLGTWTRAVSAHPRAVPVPVVCVGNLVAGGAGKTPVAIAVLRALQRLGAEPTFVTRGYGGRLVGPEPVDRAKHDASQVGDEALLLAAAGPCWVARDRSAGIDAAARSGADCVVLDDGFQNPTVAKTVSLVVIDGGYGFGNGRVMPAGPLREPVESGLARADAAVLLGADAVGVGPRLEAAVPVLRARLVPSDAAPVLTGARVVAFAGIGRPEKFFDTLGTLGAELVAVESYPDHHPYTPDEVMRLVEGAAELGARLVTTEKDAARLPHEARPMVEVLPVVVDFDRPEALDALLRPLVGGEARHVG